MRGQSTPLSIKTVTIIGTGLLGGSLGLALRKAGYTGQIIGTGSRLTSLENALVKGCIDTVQPDLGKAISAADLIVLAGPVNTFEPTFKAIAFGAPSDVVVTDVGSTKLSVCQSAAASLGKLASRFVGAHPMAGSEKKGPGHACAELFESKPCVITPDEKTDPAALKTVSGLWSGIGMRVIRLSAQEHDRAVARVSHVPHAAASCLINLGLRDKTDGQVASTGFKDTTRIGSGDPDLWREIFLSNRQAVIDELDAYIAELSAFREALNQNDGPALHKTLAQAKEARDTWTAQFIPGQCSNSEPQ